MKHLAIALLLVAAAIPAAAQAHSLTLMVGNAAECKISLAEIDQRLSHIIVRPSLLGFRSKVYLSVGSVSDRVKRACRAKRCYLFKNDRVLTVRFFRSWTQASGTL